MGLRQLLAAGGPLKIIKGTFYFIFQAYFVLNILKMFVLTFYHVVKQLDRKAQVNLKIYEVRD